MSVVTTNDKPVMTEVYNGYLVIFISRLPVLALVSSHSRQALWHIVKTGPYGALSCTCEWHVHSNDERLITHPCSHVKAVLKA